MGGRFVLALDAGGGGAGALVLDPESGATAFAHRPWRHRPVQDDRWAFDFDCRAAWRLLTEAAAEAMAAAGARPSDLTAIAATGMRHATIVLAADGAEAWAAPNRDARGAGQASTLSASAGDQIYRRTGLWPAPMLPIARLRWLRENEPALLESARCVLSASDWLTLRLSGELVAEATQASATGLAALPDVAWDASLASHAGIDPAILPPIVPTGTTVGTLTAGAARDLGLAPGIPVVAAPADSQAALLAAGAFEPGQAIIVAGTTMPILAVTASPLVDPANRLWSGAHPCPGRWVLESNAGAGGEALDLLATMFFPGDPLGVARLAAEAVRALPGAGGILSDLGTTTFNAAGLGLPVGAVSLSSLAAFGSSEPRANLFRAVLEGLAFGARTNIDQLEAVIGEPLTRVAMSGGLSRSDAWCQLAAECLGRPLVRTRIPQGSLLGAAIAAAAPAYGGLDASARLIARPGDTFHPGAEGPDTVARYDDWSRHREARGPADESASDVILRAGAEPRQDAITSPAAPPPGFRPTVLVTAPLDEASLARLRAVASVRYEPYMEAQRVLTGDDLVEACAGVDVLVTEVDVVDREALARLPALRAIFSCRADPVNIDVAACTAYGVPVMNAPGRNARAVAELTLAFLLALIRKTTQADRFLRDPATTAGDIARMGMAHADFEGRELASLVVGLVGFGQVGREVAHVLRPLGAHVIAADPFANPVEALAAGVEIVPLEDLLRRADAVSLHAPVTDETRAMFGPEQFAAMKRGSFFINTARAALADEAALEQALASGHLGGAALDVFSIEPPGHDHPSLRHPNVIATPHIGGNTAEVAARQGRMAAEAIEALLAGRAPRGLLNPATLAGFSWTAPRRAPSPAALASLATGPGPAVTDLERDDQPDAPVRQPGPRTDSRINRLLGGLRRSRRTRQPAISAPPPATSPLPPGAPSDGYWHTLFARFVERLPNDEAVRRFAASKNVMVRYHVQDLDLVFHTGFIGDPPIAGLGEPPVAPHLTLRMTSAVLDDVFLERISGMKAAMSGKMAFSGNTMRAMALQRVQKDLNRVYRSVREELGEPPAHHEQPTATGQQQPRSSAIALQREGREHAALAGDERDEMMLIINELFAAHLLTSTGGNVSIRRPGHPNEAWITPSALPKGHLHAGMLVRISLDGEPLDEGSLAPSSERLLHTAIYRARPEIEAVVHSHGPRAFALGLSGLPFLPVSTESAFIGELPRVPFIMPGTEELAAATAAAMAEAPAALLVNHGLVTAARSLRRAADMTAVIEQTAGALMECHAAGTPPPVLPPEVVAQLREIGEMLA